MVTHSRDEAYKFCSQLTLLNNGKDILTGETRDIFENLSVSGGCKADWM